VYVSLPCWVSVRHRKRTLIFETENGDLWRADQYLRSRDRDKARSGAQQRFKSRRSLLGSCWQCAPSAAFRLLNTPIPGQIAHSPMTRTFAGRRSCWIRKGPGTVRDEAMSSRQGRVRPGTASLGLSACRQWTLHTNRLYLCFEARRQIRNHWLPSYYVATAARKRVRANGPSQSDGIMKIVLRQMPLSSRINNDGSGELTGSDQPLTGSLIASVRSAINRKTAL